MEYAGGTKAPSLALQWRARIFAYYAHSVDSNAPGEGALNRAGPSHTCRLESKDLPSPDGWGRVSRGFWYEEMAAFA